MPLDHRDKRALYLGLAACALIIGAFFGYQKLIEYDENDGLSYCTNRQDENMNCLICSQLGRVIYDHEWWGKSCEMKAWDAGKQCIFDNECDKGVCIYSDEKAPQGSCDDYTHDNGYYCHKPWPANQVYCGRIFG